MPDRLTLVHPVTGRRKEFPPAPRSQADRYLAAGWEVDGAAPGWLSARFDAELPASDPQVPIDQVRYVPDGSVAEVLDWVGDDPDRARAALAVERNTSGRSTLIPQLEQIVDTPDEGEKETEQ